jgi:uncharacterized caspase-like protein
MKDKSIAFARAARDADVALVCYSGHAMQFGGFNYLMPVDAALHDEADLRRLNPNPPSGTIILYATQAGRTAADGRGHSSPYTMAFLTNIETKEEIGTVFCHITAEVYR